MVATRDEHGRFIKGASGNPGGKRLGLSEQARAATHDGAELIRFFVDTFRDEAQDRKIRLQAAEWLADRGWGKAVQQTDLNVTSETVIALKWEDGNDDGDQT